VPADPLRVQFGLAKARAIWEKLDGGELPSRDFFCTSERLDFACVDCAWRSQCWSAEGYFSSDADQLPPPALYQRDRLLGQAS
jgi:hypothetical protein